MQPENAMADLHTFLEPAQRLGFALAIGFLVGVERGWKQREEREGQRVAGVRTFALAGLLGGISGLLTSFSGGLAIVIASAFSIVFILFQFGRADQDDNSATSAVAGILVFGLGSYAVLGEPMLAVSAAVAVTVILAFKQGLHAWLGSLTWPEVRSALLILVATFLVLPFLPAGPVDPWGLFEPRTLWLFTIAIAGASFGGYVALRMFGNNIGLAVGALIGGLVSSTAVTLDFARRAQTTEMHATTAASGAALAAIASLARVTVVTTLLSADLIAIMWLPLAMAMLALAVGAIVLRTLRPEAEPSALADVRSPMNIVSVGRFAAILALLMTAANVGSRTFGQAGLNAFAATAGLVDVDAVTLSLGNLLNQNLSVHRAADALGLGLISNQLFKVAAALFTGSRDFAWRLGLVVLAATGAATVVYSVI